MRNDSLTELSAQARMGDEERTKWSESGRTKLGRKCGVTGGI
jgi:hypothetical protein